jgi:hypothetical protein
MDKTENNCCIRNNFSTQKPVFLYFPVSHLNDKESNRSKMNRIAIEFNNMAVEELKHGYLYQALELVTLSCLLISEQNHFHVDCDRNLFRFSWHDCAQGAFRAPMKLTQSSGAFLYFNFLTINASAPNDEIVDRLCPCAFAWAIWYK